MVAYHFYEYKWKRVDLKKSRNKEKLLIIMKILQKIERSKKVI